MTVCIQTVKLLKPCPIKLATNFLGYVVKILPRLSQFNTSGKKQITLNT